ncbi:MAG: efflux RND transporter periplasmic adaptor subunit [Clostridia bacterium]|nr:efflux RND transporter periplasmic adaptor subunit [Clostridia bacterium]
MKKVKASLAMLGITAAAVTALLGVHAAKGSLPTERAARVETCQVTIGSVEQVLAVSGVVRYEMEYGAISPVTGVVEQVYVRQGDRVKAGQPLFRLNGDMQAMAVSAALAGQESLPEVIPDELASSQLQEAAATLECLTVRAAADGLVQQVSISPHGGVLAGSVAVALSGEEQSIQCSVVLRDAEKLTPGLQARIIKDDELLTMARVEEIAPAQVSTTTGQTVCQARLKPERAIDLPLGATVEVEVILHGQEDVPVLPLQAVSEHSTVWWVCDGRGYEIPAEVVMADEVCCWVNLPEGITVVCGGDEVTQGQRVKEMKP